MKRIQVVLAAVFGVATGCLPAASVLVADNGANQVDSFGTTTSGAWAFHGTLIPSGTYDGQALSNPFGLAFDGAHVYVSEGVAGGRVLQFTPGGSFVQTIHDFGTTTTPRYLSWAPDGRLLMTDAFGSAGDNVWQIDVGAKTVAVFITQPGGSFNNPQDLTFAPDGFLYVADRQTNRIKQFNGTTGALVNANFATVTNPLGLVWDDAGNRFLCGAGFTGDLVAISTAGAVTTVLNETHGEGFLDALLIDGQTYVSRYSTGATTGGVYRLTGPTSSTEVTDGYISAASSNQMIVVPEPACLVLAGLSMACLCGRKRTRWQGRR